MPRPRVDWRPILLEASFVVLGVVLALGANELRRAHLNRQDAATALASIRNELHNNRAAVLDAVQYHVRLTDTLTVLARSGAPGNPAPPDARLFARGFFHPATLLHTAWDAAAATDAVRHMRFDDVLRLAQIYEEQERYRRQSEQVGQLIFSQLFVHGFQGMLHNHTNLATILATFWYRECQLLHRYAEILEQLGSPPPPEPDAIPERCGHVPPR